MHQATTSPPAQSPGRLQPPVQSSVPSVEEQSHATLAEQPQHYFPEFEGTDLDLTAEEMRLLLLQRRAESGLQCLVTPPWLVPLPLLQSPATAS